MSAVRLSDILFRCGASTLLQYGVPWRRFRTDGREPEAPTFTRADATTCATYFDKGNVLRLAAAGKLRLDYGLSGTVATIPLEAAATNVALWCRDMTNAAWVKSNITAAKDQTGIDGVTNSASSLLATAGNGTCLQAVTLASSQRFQSCYIKRLVGTGTVNMTTDNGSTWTAVTVTAAWTRVSIPAQTLANPTLGFRLVTNTDKIAVDFVQNETGPYASNPIATTTAAVPRASEVLYGPTGFPPAALTFYVKFIEGGTIAASGTPGILNIANAGDDSPGIELRNSGSFYRMNHNTAAGSVQSTLGAAPTVGDTVELLAPLGLDGSVQVSQSLNGAAATTAAASGALALATAWSGNRLYLNSLGSGYIGRMGLIDCLVAAGTFSLAEMQAAPVPA